MDKRALGEKITRLRKLEKLSQEDLAEKSGVGRRTLQKIEAGRANATLDTLMALADVFKISFLELTGASPRESLTHSMARAARPTPLLEAANVLHILGSANPLDRLAALYVVSRDETYLEQMLEIPDEPSAGALVQALRRLP